MNRVNEIRNKIKSMQSTYKLTKAMEMLAASKMHKAQERIYSSRPYADKVCSITRNIMHSYPEYNHKFISRNVESEFVGLILITTDKGLCGNLNSNILRLTLDKIKELKILKKKVLITVIGNKGIEFVKNMNLNLIASIIKIGDSPKIKNLIGAIKSQLDKYLEGKISMIYLAYTKFIKIAKYYPIIKQLLPLFKDNLKENIENKKEKKIILDYIYEPNPQTIINDLFIRYIEALVYQAVVENIASEQSARMIAMQSASDNTKNIISELQLSYNKNRQSIITKELSEIISGASAI